MLALDLRARIFGMADDDHVHQPGKSAFPNTSWGLVLAAGDDLRGRDAFGMLCRRYWSPIYASLRRKGFAPTEAEDRVQGFFLHVIEQNTFTHADRSRGRFRSFLFGALRRFLASEDEHERALKRGGGRRFIALDAPEMEALMWASSDDTLSLDLQFDRQWARMLLVNALAVLRDEHERSGQALWFESLQACLDPGAVTPSY